MPPSVTHPAIALPKTFVWELLREEPLVVIAPQQLSKPQRCA